MEHKRSFIDSLKASRTRIAVAAGALALVGSIGGAKAGIQLTQPVTVSQYGSGVTVVGNLNDTRHDGHASTYIGCLVYAAAGLNGNIVQCYAVDASNTFGGCISWGADATPLIPALSAMTSSSTLEFDTDANGKCTRVVVTNGSWLTPATP